MGDEKIGQGRENAITFLQGNEELRATLETKLRAKLFPGQIIKKIEAPAPDSLKKTESAAKKPKVEAPAADGGLF